MAVPFASMSEYLEWDSMPMNWLLFKKHKLAVPQRGEWRMLLMDMRMKVPDVTGAVLASSEVIKMLSALQQPAMLITDYIAENYVLGSGWAFMGGLPDLDGSANERFAGLKRFRFMTFLNSGRMTNISCIGVRPGLVAFVRVEELSGRLNRTFWGIVDKEAETIVDSGMSIDVRGCPMCFSSKEKCEGALCQDEQYFGDLWNSRMVLKLGLQPRWKTLEFFAHWFSGTWTIPVANLEPVKVLTTCYRAGKVFEGALLAVVQDEVLGVHPPRSSFRTVKYVREAVKYFVDLEERDPFLPGADVLESDLPSDFDSEGAQSSSGQEVSNPVLPKNVCEICGAKFKRNYEAKRHRETVHEKLRENKCPVCSRTFSQKGHLNEHIRVTHSENNVHSCRFCGKKFGVKSKMTRHVATVHENRRTFKCEMCNQWYKEKAYLKRHMLSQHGAALVS
uniref:C2H2-type domain-containing protein n=1 Tax=Rhodosorus marinus TaxID=101924 RepID=A0A7S3A4Q4_9RHOD|mmetsp:Transcript_42697/g.166848  ORF Transcript_42697/g.166848 Transcript_42697/m.166848 type:complete len:448 (+) Transcript_42697:423-1766(+)|eukprot:CAMPEP_0113954888 /NCGR_PEP_ID=MMETSP0011_2-20120614/919_1 /TAXON_ID=101924 /ORGANISM="Rhodosorus marinus" /LENGTH=447 /DNA_ID=CAMNT_0000964299 /DNA_START=545 /DNA_END=1888 /DNA_ORIENTATION=- /assembly_acc=CAM_ASM_000156